ncbi:gasdermin-C-like [Cricetulus griseus]|uniref:Gasdermin-C-like n=1 Tax=Cricetulus griseus TaxID=10029 RepID=A0A9J7K1V6_CRIGR|nr:gasdermin-C-like [Cricetulus griseus]
MRYSFNQICKDVVKELEGKDLRPVKYLSEAKNFRQFEILQKTTKSWHWKSEYIPVGYSLLEILEPNFPVPEPEVSAPMPFRLSGSKKLKGGLGVNAIAEGSVSAGIGDSYEYDIEVQCTSIRASKLEILQNRKLVEKEPTFMKDCRIRNKDLYVVTEAYEVTRDTVLEDSSSVDLSGQVLTPQFGKVQVQGEWQREKKRLVPILKGAVVAFKKKQLVIENDTCAILLCDDAKKKTFPGMFPGSKVFLLPQLFQGSHLHSQCCVPSFQSAEAACCLVLSSFMVVASLGPGRLSMEMLVATGNEFQHLQNEISEKTWKLARLSKDVQEVVFCSLLPMLRDREILYDLMIMLEMGELGHMDGPGGVILDELRKDPWTGLHDLILYLLNALMVLSDTQLNLLALSMEKRLLLQQRELVKSILQQNFKYPWNIPFTLQPELLAPLQGEGLAITYELLKECGLKMELDNPRSTWDLEAKMPMAALYGSLSFLQQLLEA